MESSELLELVEQLEHELDGDLGLLLHCQGRLLVVLALGFSRRALHLAYPTGYCFSPYLYRWGHRATQCGWTSLVAKMWLYKTDMFSSELGPVFSVQLLFTLDRDALLKRE